MVTFVEGVEVEDGFTPSFWFSDVEVCDGFCVPLWDGVVVELTEVSVLDELVDACVFDDFVEAELDSVGSEWGCGES